MITVYTKPNCPYCVKAKAWLENNNIEYQEINIVEDTNAITMLKEHGHKTVPQIYLNEKLFVEGGYTGLSSQDPSELKTKLMENTNVYSNN
jgi:glutaredoxin 3